MAKKRRTSAEVEQACNRRAAGQRGLIARAQSMRRGATTSFIKHKLATRRWREVLRGVYVVAGAPDSWEQRVQAALLWTGPDGAACGRTAGRLWGLEGVTTQVVEVAIKNKRAAPADWLVVHRMDRSRPLDAGTLRGLRVTSPAVTLLDLAGVLPSEKLEFALEDALRRKLTTVAKLEATLRRLGGRGVAGTNPLRRLVTERGSGYVPTASQLEVRMNRILKRCSLPRAKREFLVALPDDGRAFIDFAYPDIKLGIEVDGYGAHVGSKRQWQRDMSRENALKRLGWIILHFSWEDVRDRPTMVENEIRRWLGQRQFPLSSLI